MHIQESGFEDMETLSEAARKAKDDFNNLQTQINAADFRMKDITALQKYIGAYVKTKDVYAAYRKSGYSKKFLAEQEEAINKCKAAKAYFDEQKMEKLPTIKMLQTEYATLAAEKKSLYSGYRATRKLMQDILSAKQNAEQLIGYRDNENERDGDRARR